MTNTLLQIIIPIALFVLLSILITIIIMVIPFIIGSKVIPTTDVFKTDTIDMPIDKLFSLITDYENYPKWRKYLRSVIVSKDSDGKTVWKEYYKFSRHPIVFTELKKSDNTLINRSLTNEYIEVCTITLSEKNENETLISIRETSFFGHPPIRFFSKFLVRKDKSINDMIRCIKKECERNEA